MLSILGLSTTYILRWIFVALAIYIVFACTYSLFATKSAPEIWGYFNIVDGEKIPITHWENVIGRNKSADIRIDNDTLSKDHALLTRKGNGKWLIKDLNSHNGVRVNGEPIKEATITSEDSITIGDTFTSVEDIIPEAQPSKKVMSLIPVTIAITVFQALTILQLLIGTENKLHTLFPIIMLSVIMWAYILFFTYRKVHGFELELIAFFMTTINLAVMASSEPDRLKTEMIAIVVGIGLMIFMCVYMRDIKRVEKIKPILIGLAIIALIINMLIGDEKNGASNWINIAGNSLQPSELVKVAFLFIGAETLDKLYDRKNTLLYALFALFCVGCLVFMSDFGTAAIFLATYLVVSFLRSGDFSRMILSAGALASMGLMVIKMKPYIADRFSAWRHVWEPDFVGDKGFQQTRTMSYGAGGGLLGLGAGNGSLHNLGAANTDLVFGYVMEEWGLIIAILMVLCIAIFTYFAFSHILAGRSTFYTILACGTASMMLVQTMLNVFGSVDILPLTGVTLPFVSAGGTSMVASWAMLACLKVSDMRPNASLAVKWRKEAKNA